MNHKCMRRLAGGGECEYHGLWKLSFHDTPKVEWFCTLHLQEEVCQRDLVKIERYLLVSSDKVPLAIPPYGETYK